MRDHLPALLAEIAEVAGLAAALAIAEAKGGTVVNIPSGKKKRNWLIDCVGPEAAAKISAHFTSGRGRLQLDIPLPPTNSHRQWLRQRAKVYQSAIETANSLSKAALMAGTTRRTLQRFNHVRKGRKKSDGQGSLF